MDDASRAAWREWRLQVGRRDLRARPLAERRLLLEDQLDGPAMVLRCRPLPNDGAKAWAIVEER